MANIDISMRIYDMNLKDLGMNLESDLPWLALARTTFAMADKKDLEQREISLSFCDEAEIQKLNNEYRSKDAVTDVLSFEAEDPLLGDIVICMRRALEQAFSYNHSLQRELAFLFVHGLLHLLGYDHQNDQDEKAMFELQEKILEENNICR